MNGKVETGSQGLGADCNIIKVNPRPAVLCPSGADVVRPSAGERCSFTGQSGGDSGIGENRVSPVSTSHVSVLDREAAAGHAHLRVARAESRGETGRRWSRSARRPAGIYPATCKTAQPGAFRR